MDIVRAGGFATFVDESFVASGADAVQWVERIAVDVLADATAGAWPKIPQEDIELDIIRVRRRGLTLSAGSFVRTEYPAWIVPHLHDP
jgi:hypothetical protein